MKPAIIRKIDIFYKHGKSWQYACSTTQHRLCRDARQSWADIHTDGKIDHIKAIFAK